MTNLATPIAAAVDDARVTVAERIRALTAQFVDLVAEVDSAVLADDVLAEDVLADDELLELTAVIEASGRVVDGLRLSTAAEVSHRSRKSLGADRLSARRGCRNDVELLTRLTRVLESTAARRIRLGTALRTRDSLTGERMPARCPLVAEAVAAGELGLDSAAIIVGTLSSVEFRADRADRDAAEQAMVGCAVGYDPASGEHIVPFTADQTRTQAVVWQAALDPDGVEASETEAMRRRGVVKSGVRDGLVRYRMDLMPEVSARLERVFDSLLSPKVTGRFLTEDEEQQAAQTRDERTPSQQRHDALASVLDIATRSADLPSNGGSPPTVLVSVRAEDLVAGTGPGWVEGAETPISMDAVTQFACTGGIQKAWFSETGRLIALGSPDRIFTPQQRRAIAVRDGGCVIPGCSIPASWCEIHHVQEHARGGPTHTDNGVLLCWYHHRSIDTSGWSVTMRDGVPHLRAPRWIDPSGTWRPAARSRVDQAGRFARRC